MRVSCLATAAAVDEKALRTVTMAVLAALLACGHAAPVSHKPADTGAVTEAEFKAMHADPTSNAAKLHGQEFQLAGTKAYLSLPPGQRFGLCGSSAQRRQVTFDLQTDTPVRPAVGEALEEEHLEAPVAANPVRHEDAELLRRVSPD